MLKAKCKCFIKKINELPLNLAATGLYFIRAEAVYTSAIFIYLLSTLPFHLLNFFHALFFYFIITNLTFFATFVEVANCYVSK